MHGREKDAMIATDFSYSDQSHMIREFEDLTGYSPAVWRRRIKSDLFNTGPLKMDMIGPYEIQ